MQSRSAPVLLRLLSFARPYWHVILLAWVFVGAASAFMLLMPLLLEYAIDVGINPQTVDDELVALGSKRTLVIVGIAVMVVAALRGVFAYGQTYVGEWLSSRVAYDLRNEIYNHLQRLSFAYHDKAQTGQLMSRATQDVEAVRMFINFGVLRVLNLVILLVVVLILMATTNWKLALIAWIVVPIVAARSIQVSTRLRPIWLEIQNLQGRMGTVLQENLSGMRVVKAFAREEQESEKFSKEAKDLFDNAFKANRIQASNQPCCQGSGSSRWWRWSGSAPIRSKRAP